ncbi:NifB/NifX family molybdenum-iron cluster-binding protein [bacterium]|nr:NifB/NifX family molybdenum-iron cluster-binding protein [candidate division CSSED10-310 bacterium]
MIPDWDGRVSPVFDVAKCVLIVDLENNREQGRSRHRIDSTDPLIRASKVTGLGTEILICCAISRSLENALTSAGIQIICGVCGQVEDVLVTYIDGRLEESRNRVAQSSPQRKFSRARRYHGRPKR